MAKREISDADFMALLKKSYENAHGDLMRFWDLLNNFADADMIERTFNPAKEAFIFVNNRKGAYGAFTAFVARFEREKEDGSVEKVDYDVVFKALKKPKFNGYIKIKHAAFKNVPGERKKMYIYEYDFERAKGLAESADQSVGDVPDMDALPF